MVARVDRALKDDLGIEDGLAAENVYVLDPCCGTGAYLAETLKRIAVNLQDKGLGALTGARVKQAATQRVFGFEIMPAPFVVAHLQVGLTMQALDAPLSEDGNERAGVFLTNALTGWEPRMQKPLPFPELEEERDRAERVKQDTPVLVILGNPPYNGFAGMAVDEERELSEAYRTVREVRKPEGQGLNDLYVRFFRMAERRIAEKTGRGVVCFISNYSWLEGLSFTGMRERYLEVFDAIRIDNLHGDRMHHLGICARWTHQRNSLCHSRAVAGYQDRHGDNLAVEVRAYSKRERKQVYPLSRLPSSEGRRATGGATEQS